MSHTIIDPFRFGTSGSADTGDSISNSLMLDDTVPQYLTKTLSSPTNNKKWTLSTWVKRARLSGEVHLFRATGAGDGQLYWNSTNQALVFRAYGVLNTYTPYYRDPSAWYHIVVTIDTDNATAADRLRIWINNTLLTNPNNPSSGATSTFNSNAAHTIGDYDTSTTYAYGGLLADFIFLDNQALTPSDFGRTSADTGAWVPKTYAGAYTGTNTFHLKFDNSADLGNDSTSNNNDWTLNGSIVAANQFSDTPTNNYCTLNPIIASAANISKGALTSGATAVQGTMDALLYDSYWEVAAGAGAVTAGTISGTGTTNTTTVTANKTFGFRLTAAGALDYKNITDAGAWTSITTGLSGQQFPYGVTAAGTWNFGQKSGTSGLTLDSAAGGYFLISGVPTGFKALCTTNMPTPAIAKGSDYVGHVTYTGTGSSNARTGMGHTPDLVAIRSRSAATDWAIYDSVRGVQKRTEWNNTDAQVSTDAGLTSFDSDGFTVNTLAQVNTNTSTYFAFGWKRGATPGIDVVTWSGDNTANRNIDHSCGAAPGLVIAKRTDSTGKHYWYHRGMSGVTSFGDLGDYAGYVSAGTNSPWGTGNWSSTQFMVTNNATNNLNATGASYYAWLFAEVAGFSKFGTYTGNGSADGPFVYCGFKPRFVVVYANNNSGRIRLINTEKQVYNVLDTEIPLDYAAVSEQANTTMDWLSNGFKLRTSGSEWNSATTNFYWAFAESPFKYSNAR
jgi:hypothetical protein